jgi:hypothetical protein
MPKARPSTGDQIAVTTNDFFASLLHISRLPEESLCFTVVPLNTSFKYVVGNNEVMALQPPKLLNMMASWPLTDESVGESQIVERAAAKRPQPTTAER